LKKSKSLKAGLCRRICSSQREQSSLSAHANSGRLGFESCMQVKEEARNLIAWGNKAISVPFLPFIAGSELLPVRSGAANQSALQICSVIRCFFQPIPCQVYIASLAFVADWIVGACRIVILMLAQISGFLLVARLKSQSGHSR
jgi:hypothetical protein